MRTMRRLGAAAAVAIFLAVPGASAQDDFEGVIAYDMTMSGMNMQITQMVKGTMIRQEMQTPTGQIVNITDTEAMTMTTMMPAQKMYTTINMKQMAEQLAAQTGQPVPESPKPADFKPTGEKETIAGHACEHYAYTQNGMNLDICIAASLGFVPMMSGGLSATQTTDIAEWKKLFPNGFLPLSMEVTSQGQTITMRATSIEKKSVSADLFKVPAGYTAIPGVGD